VDAATLIGPALIDNSAWARLNHPSLDAARSEEVAEAIVSGRLIVCLPFLLEAGFSARSGADHELMLNRLSRLPEAPITRLAEARALEAQRQLAIGHHRLPPTDLVLAAIADIAHVDILHYDHDFELILEKTTLRFDSIWLAEPGSL
jgi:predicted nucleic acid-binding protein